jgi:hypothetical protein
MNSERNKVMFIRFCYWLGAILDALMAIGMTLYMVFNTQFYLGLLYPSDQAKLALRHGTGLMIGWTVLLIWGDQKPIERKELLLMTAFPVVIMGMIYDLILFSAGNQFLNLSGLIQSYAIRIPLSAVFTIGYYIARSLKPDK